MPAKRKRKPSKKPTFMSIKASESPTTGNEANSASLSPHVIRCPDATPSKPPSTVVSLAKLHEWDRQYLANPQHQWLSTEHEFKCSTAQDDTFTSTLVWQNSLKIAQLIEGRSKEGFEQALQMTKTLGIDSIDCFLPVLRTAPAFGFGRCADCRYQDGQRKLSILRLWLGGRVTAENQPVMAEFFRSVLLPSGFATRFNERVNCVNQTALEFVVNLTYGSYTPSKSRILDQALMISGLPEQLELTLAPLQKPSSQHRKHPNYDQLRADFDRHQTYQKQQNQRRLETFATVLESFPPVLVSIVGLYLV